MAIETEIRRSTVRAGLSPDKCKRRFGLSSYNRAVHFVSYTRSTFESSGALPTISDFLLRINLDESVVQTDFEKLALEIDLLRRTVNKTQADRWDDLVFGLLQFIIHYKNQATNAVFTKVSVRILENCVASLKSTVAGQDHSTIFSKLEDCASAATILNDVKCGLYIGNFYYNYGIILWKTEKKLKAVDAWACSIAAQRQFSDELLCDTLVKKLERLAIAYAELQMFAEAAETLNDAITDSMLAHKQQLESLSSIASLKTVTSKFLEIDRLVLLYVNVILQASTYAQVFPSEHKRLGTALNGLFDEWILKTLVSSTKPTASALIEAVVTSLVLLYRDEFPIRYARSLVSALPLAFTDESKLKAVECAKDVINRLNEADYGCDIKLVCFKDDLVAACSLYMQVFCYQLKMRDDSSDSPIGIWANITDSDSLERAVVDRVALISNLQLLSDFYHIQGDLQLYVQALQCCCKVAKNFDAQVALHSTVSLSLAHLTLGYSGQASEYLRAAHTIGNVDSTETNCLQLSEVEYFVAIGNLDKAKEKLVIIQQSLQGREQSKPDSTPILTLKAQAFYTLGLVLLENGDSRDALSYAKAAVNIWNRAIFQQTKVATKSNSSAGANNSLSSLWPLLLSLMKSYIQIANIYDHQGMVRETEFYLNEALRLVGSFRADMWTSYIGLLLGDFYLRSGNLSKSGQLLAAALESSEIKKNSILEGKLQHTLARYYEKLEVRNEQIRSYTNAESCLRTAVQTPAFDSDRTDLEHLLAELTITNKGRKKKPGQNGKKAMDCVGLNRSLSNVLRSKSKLLILQEEWQEAESVLKDAASTCMVPKDHVMQSLAESRYHFKYALSLLQSDPVYGVLQESVISIPSVSTTKHSIKSSKELSSTAVVSTTQARSRRAKTSSPKSVSSKDFDEVHQVLAQSRQLMLDQYFSASVLCNVRDKQAVFNHLGKVLMLQSAVGPVKEDVYSPAANYFLELARGLSLVKDSSAASDDDFPATFKSATSYVKSLNLNDFQKDYVDIIPPRWAAVSISICEDSRDLVVSRFQAGESPFLLKLPLDRHCSRDADEDTFSYADALAEFKDIISRNNETAQASKKLQNGTKSVKQQWWADRHALDVRLKELLTNIEYVWLGGFRGILSNTVRNRDLLSKFSASFMVILKKHLPSRRAIRTRQGTKSKAPEVKIDPRVLELFIGLGDPQDSDNSEMLEDLIYFILDILQFHGECNAYDELDMDQIVVDVQEVLRAYYESLEEENDSKAEHIVLILDKSVQMFPWESLPCLREQSVSRLPSLASLRDVLQSGRDRTIDSASGAYLLNPSGDLVNTQSMFEDNLTKFKDWSSIVGRAPTEEEFKSCVSSKEIFLYFGHGGGEQYIRPSQIKQLEKCAATFLFGCSSGALHNAQEFEPWGTPMSYLIGGCRSLVSNLWDVTDKDIDKFADEMFGLWGLYDSEGTRPRNTQPCSLGMAMAAARDVCTLKYLNGAAPVMYGVPLELLKNTVRRSVV
ncbi:peptidase family C50-domain-containing protein [Lipomyces arxii]|uniref:peptidase family C50-domain-containing protein n=1 Tax=Lipomyces arxii TaxID=56418 RepID=UPI0034CFA486